MLYKFHEGVSKGINGKKARINKASHARLWWPTLFTNYKYHAMRNAMFIRAMRDFPEEMNCCCNE